MGVLVCFLCTIAHAAQSTPLTSDKPPPAAQHCFHVSNNICRHLLLSLSFAGLPEPVSTRESAQQSNGFQANDFYKINEQFFISGIVLARRPISCLPPICTFHTSRRWIFCDKGDLKNLEIRASKLLCALGDDKKILPH